MKNIASTLRRSRWRFCKVRYWCLVSAMTATAMPAHAQVLWSNSSGTNWTTGSNWTGGSVPTASQVARFSANPSGTSGVGINFSSTTNGDNTPGQRTQLVGAIEMIDRQQNFLIGNSSTTNGANGFLVLHGASVNGIAQTILRNTTTNRFDLQNTQGSGKQMMGVRLGGALSVVQIDGIGGITIASAISQATSGSRIEVRGMGEGQLDLQNTSNSYSGGVNIYGAQLRITDDGSLGAVPSSGVANHIILNGGRLATPANGSIIVLHANRGVQIGDAAGTAFNVGGSTVMRYNGTITDLPGVIGVWTKVGTGILELGGVSTYSGATNIGQGTLRMIEGSNRLPATTVVRLGTVASAQLGTLDLNGWSQHVSGLVSTPGINNTTTTNIITSASPATLTISTPSGASHVYSEGTRSNSGVISGAIGVNKLGAGMQGLGGPNTYNRTTTNKEGAPLLNRSHTGGGAYTVRNGGMLGGSGSIASPVIVEAGGMLSPGASIGLLTIDRNVSFQPDGVFVVEFNLAGADQLVVTGATSTLNTDDALLVLRPTGLGLGPLEPISVTYTIATTPNNPAGVLGVFKNLVHLAGNTYQYRDGPTVGIVTYGGSSISVTITQVPDPGSGLGLGIATLLLIRRRTIR